MVAGAVLAGLIATGIARGSSKIARRAYEAWQSGQYPLTHDLTVEFTEALEDELQDAGERSEDENLAAFAEGEVDWEQVKWNLDDAGVLAADGQEEAVTRVTEAIVATLGGDVEKGDTEWDAIEDAVLSAYGPTVEAFYERIAGTDDADVFSFWSHQRTREEVGRLREDVVSLLVPKRPYTKLDADEEGFERARNVLDARAFEFADRPELDGQTGTGKTLVKGWAGSGKSRSLMELLDRIERADADEAGSRVEHIILPQTLRRESQLTLLENDHYRGDVVLVWDDVQDIDPDDDNRVFRNAIDSLEQSLDDQGHDLHVLAAVRSEDVETLPSYGNYRRGEGFWSDFETVELRRPDALTESVHERSFLRRVVDYALDYHGIDAGSEAVRERLAEKAARVEPSPFYVASVVEVAARDDGELTKERVEEVPEDPAEFWEDQWELLVREYDEAPHALRAMALLGTVGIPLFSEPVRGVYEEVIGRDRHEFGGAVDVLVEQQWVFPEGEDSEDEPARLQIHDLKLSVVEVDVEGEIQRLSVFLEDELEEFLPKGIEKFEAQAHFKFTVFLNKTAGTTFDDVVKKHYQILLEKFDEKSAIVHSNYGLFLYERRRYAEAEDQFRAAIEADPEFVVAHYNYGRLLKDQGRYNEAEAHYKVAIKVGPDHATAYYNYGRLLQEQGRYDEAETQYAAAIKANPNHADAHYNYGVLLQEQGRYDEAEVQYEAAIEANPGDTDAPFNYGVLLQEQGRYDEAEVQYAAVIEADSDDAEAHSNYAHLLYEQNEQEEAREYVDTSVNLWRGQGDTSNVLNDLRLLVHVCEDLNDIPAATDNCILALELAHRANKDFEEHLNWSRSRCLKYLEDGVPADVEPTYDWALRALRAYTGDVSGALFEELWSIRQNGGGDGIESRITNAAGVAYAAHLDTGFQSDSDDEPSEILQAVTPDHLPPSPKSLYDLLALDYPDVDLVPDDETDDVEPLHEDEDAAFGRLMALVG